MGARTENWILYVDESGDFDVAGGHRVLAGLLLRGREDPQESAALRSIIEGIFPLAEWPPHACVLNQPASRAWLALRRPTNRSAGRDAARARIERAVRLLETSDDPRAVQFRASAHADDAPPYELLLSVGHFVREADRAAWNELTSLVRTEERLLTRFLHSAGCTVEAGNVVLVGAVADDLEEELDAGPERQGELRSDAYLRGLETLMERVLMLVREEPRAPNTDVRIWTRVATRGVKLHGVRPRRWLELNAAHVADAARRAAELPSIPGRANPRVVPQEFVTRFDSTVHPGVVLADFVANRSRHALAHADSWTLLERRIAAAIGLAPKRRTTLLGNTELPGIAAPGLPREAIVAAFRSAPVPSLSSVPIPWEREQAEAWVTEIVKVRP